MSTKYSNKVVSPLQSVIRSLSENVEFAQVVLLVEDYRWVDKALPNPNIYIRSPPYNPQPTDKTIVSPSYIPIPYPTSLEISP